MEKDGIATSSDSSIEKEGFISQSLSRDGIPNQSLSDDHIGIENISVEPCKLYEAVSALRNYGFNYLQCQGGYDEGPGKNLVSFYHFITVDDLQKIEKIREEKIIRSSLEAHIDIFVSAESYKKLEKVMFDEITITSSFSLYVIDEKSKGFSIDFL